MSHNLTSHSSTQEAIENQPPGGHSATLIVLMTKAHGRLSGQGSEVLDVSPNNVNLYFQFVMLCFPIFHLIFIPLKIQFEVQHKITIL